MPPHSALPLNDEHHLPCWLQTAASAPPSPIPSPSSLTGNPVPPSFVHADSRHFKDTSGRTLILRGVNLSSSAKLPRGRPSHILEGFWESAERDGQSASLTAQKPSLPLSSTSQETVVENDDEGGISYVGQTLNVDDGTADFHLARLRQWGFNVVRYVTVWEAIEHQGPGIYDEEYIQDVIAVLRKCKHYGFRVYMDPHQDLFSRFTGGSGAPLWTLYACGLNPRNFTVTGAAYIHAEWPHPSKPDPATFPKMIWASNYTRFAVQTINTLFWAGKDFAPLCVIDDVNIQDYLQSHLLAAYQHLAEAIAQAEDLLDETVIGWDSINEPNPGFIGVEDLNVLSKKGVLRIGPTPTPWEAIRLASGATLTVENYKFGPVGSQKDGKRTIDPEGKTVWLDPATEDVHGYSSRYGWKRASSWKLGRCVWAQHGVWEPETCTLLKPDYFAKSRKGLDEVADYAAEYWRDHLQRYGEMVRKVHPEAILFAHPPVFEIPPDMHADMVPVLGKRAVFSSHFYDGLTLITKHWNWFNADALGILRGKYKSIILGLKIGETAIRKCMREQLALIRQDGLENMGEYPTMMGEIGIPFDLDNRKAYRDGDYSNQIKALDASLNACDGENMLNYTIWAFCPDSSHEWGDSWNGEDLSIWSSDDAHYHNTVYNTKSKKFNRLLGRPQQHKYGGYSSHLTPSASTLSLKSLVPQDFRRLGVNPIVNNRPKFKLNVTLVSGPPSETASTTSRDSSPEPELMNLNDGARALAAFCRPFPVLTLGTPTFFNFNIHEAAFELHVDFRQDDVVMNVKGDGDLCTEIFVPATHFGAKPDRFLSEKLDVESIASSSSKANRHSCRNGWDFEDLDLQVEMSDGTFRVVGQVLKWKYGPGQHWIKVKRRSGPIPVLDGDGTTLSKQNGFAHGVRKTHVVAGTIIVTICVLVVLVTVR